ncbi:acyl-CoA dehydrogenase family protein [Nocardioides sp. NPDC087217]|uniref:acyl-CoA dehydrogenase family protein n=1 Tax=Nocardioides sp. NPDC087217 TaxID=3364335 RepID=UPI0038191067
MNRTLYADDHEAFRGTVRTFLDRSVIPNLDKYAENGILPREFWLEAGELGILGLEVPSSYGGAGVDDFRFNAVVAEELAKVNLALSTAVGIHADTTAPYVAEFGNDKLRQRWLPGIASGEVVLAIGMTEPSGGSDLAALKTTAVRDGASWVVNGSKTFISNGYSADLVVTAVRTSPEKKARGITLFAVPATTPGFHRGRKLDKVGQRESDTAELFFEDVRLTDDDIVGEVDNGFIQMMQMLPQERIIGAVGNVAQARQILEETLEYVKQRKAFGSPIGSFQHNKFILAEMFTRIDVTQMYVDRCVSAHAQGVLSDVDAAKAKWWSAQVQNEILDHCVQLHGGYGFMNEYRVARAWRDARVTKIWAGSNEIMKELIGRDLGL